MPLYEYECDANGHRFEKIQKFSDPLVDTCPICGGTVHKLFSSPAIQFKGSGFYITDYPKGEKGSAPKSDGGKADRAEKAKEVKGEAGAASEKSDKAATASSEKSSTSSESPSTTSTPPVSNAASTPAPTSSSSTTSKD